MTSLSEYEEVLFKLQGVKLNSDGTRGTALCPVHNDKKPSLSFAIGNNGNLLVKCHACGAKVGDVADALGLTTVDFRDPEKRSFPVRQYLSRRDPVSTYYYRDEDGRDLYKVERYHEIKPGERNKRFSQLRKEGDSWKEELQDVRRVVYRLPEIVAKPEDIVFLVEGEKDADNLAEIGLLGTTSPGGVENFNASFAEQLRGRDVVILPDIDPINEKTGKRPGTEGAYLRANCLDGVASRVRILFLPDLNEGEDVSDWIDQGGSKEQLLDLVKNQSEEFSRERNEKRIEEAAEKVEAVRGEKDSDRIAKQLLEELYTDEEGRLTLRTYQDQFWAYKGKRFAEQSLSHFRYRIVWNFTRDELEKANRKKIVTGTDDRVPETHQTSEGFVNNVLGSLKALSSITLEEDETQEPSFPFWLDDRKRPGSFTAFENGIIDLEEVVKKGKSKILDHSPSWFSPFVLPYHYNTKAEISEDFVDYLMTVFEEDLERIALAQEFFGYCLLPSNKFQKFLALEGSGANGKSVFCVLLTALVGKDNVSNVGLDRFADRFYLVETVGKLLNIASDTSELDKAAEGAIKQFTSGDRMTFERKNEQPFSWTPTARLVVSWNNRPRFADRTDGLWRRMILLPFNATIPEHKRRPEFSSEDWWIESGHMEGILQWAIEGLRRLEDQGGFTKPEICERLLNQYRLESNPAEAFLRESFTFDPACRLPVDEVFDQYQGYCREGNYRPTNRANFGAQVRRLFPEVKRSRVRVEGGDRVSFYEGIGRKNGLSENDLDDELSLFG